MVGLRRCAVVCLSVGSLAVLARSAQGQPFQAITYQGRLTDAAAPANGVYDLQFRLFNAATGGTQVGATINNDDTTVVNGLFTARLEFFPFVTPLNNTFYLEIGVRPGASTGTYTVLPRQELTAVPNATYAVDSGHSSLSDQVPWTGISSMPSGFADGVDNDSGGDITAVSAGPGLTGGTSSGAATLSANFSGSGTATTVSRSDHNHFGAQWTGTTLAYGLWVQSSLADGIRGYSGADGASGIRGETLSSQGIGVTGYSSFLAGNSIGVQGTSNSATGIGVRGDGSGASGVGVVGASTGTNGIGVRGLTSGTTGSSAGVYGAAQIGASAGATGVWGVQGPASGSYAGYFSGRAHVNGTLSKSAGSFRIDHPLDPENKYLSHSFVESPDMMNVYNGNVVLDTNGRAEVRLPDWFEALNEEFRYQLTAIGAPGPGLHVAREIAGNRFAIAGGSPGLKVSWQVTGIRHDAYAASHRIPVEEMKPEHERGVYLQPEAHGLPSERGLDHRRRPRDLGAPHE